MVDKNDKIEPTAIKRPAIGWITHGASMSYGRPVRLSNWFANLLLYILLNSFYLRIQTGLYPWHQLNEPLVPRFLIPDLLSPLNIFQFPSYIIVTALIMCLLCTVPLIIAQLYNFFYALPFIVVVVFLAHNPILGLCLFVSCGAVSFAPMRFKSKFVSALICMLPEILYWILYSGENPEQNILRWAVLYSPWGLAFLFSVIVIGIVLTVGHFLRYKPVVLMPIFGFILLCSVLLFNWSIGMNVRDFQDQVFRVSPEEVPELQNRSIIPLLQQEAAQRRSEFSYLSDELITAQLRMEWRWSFTSNISLPKNYKRPSFVNPVSLAKREAWNVEGARMKSILFIEYFIENHPDDILLADALYYKALLTDMKVDSSALRDEDALRFYYDIPTTHSEPIWKDIKNRFGQTTVAIEAQWRLAWLLAIRKPSQPTEPYNYDEALVLLEQARQLCLVHKQNRTQKSQDNGFWANRLGTIFTPPPPSISDEQLELLLIRIEKLMTLISKENRTGHLFHDQRLAEFVALDPHQPNYTDRLKELMLNSPQPDPLQDNIELARVKLIKKTNEKITYLKELISQYPNSDGSLEAMLEVAILLKEPQPNSSDAEQRRSESRQLLDKIINDHPDSFYARLARELINADDTR